jgi:alkylated DNA repair dioxygenase AlkB
MNLIDDRIDLKDGAWYAHRERWLDEAAASDLMDHLMAEQEWVQREIMARGRPVLQPRLMSWAGELPYKYSGLVLEPRPMTGVLQVLLDRLRDELQVPFNHVVLNLYRHGRDKVAMHSDNEPELGRNPVIASFSLGATRRFVMERKRRRRQLHVKLHHGSLIVMGGTMQHDWRHALPGDTKVKEPRINITARFMRGPTGWREPGTSAGHD